MAFFGDSFFDFYRQLIDNNNREWFQENKGFYDDAVVSPMLAFIVAMGPKLGSISDQFNAIPKKQGGSMFRIYRDTRFSKDKTPYKTHAAAHFRHHMGKDAHTPGFYFHAAIDEVFVGAGIWQPPGPALQGIRKRIDEKPDEWQALLEDDRFQEHCTLAGASLKRPPRGYSADHPLIEDLKRKDHVAVCELKPEDLKRDDLVDLVAARFEACSGLVRFICQALDVPY